MHSTTWMPPSINPTNGDLPPGWEVRQTPDGRTYYIDHNIQRTTRTRPSDPLPYITPHTPPSREVLVSQQVPDHITRTPTITFSSHLNVQSLQSDGRPQAGTSQGIASAATTKTANIADSSGAEPSHVLPANTHSPTSVSVSPSPTARHDSQELDHDNSIEMRSLDHTDLSRDTSGNSA
ncbi:hypothetical protein BGW80DRAFT_1206841 [Lactifluus volemus]|nr:hypothetical protein BGW80DRAFT_1206841 [Lactifluus volemus]